MACLHRDNITHAYAWKYTGLGDPVNKLVLAESPRSFETFEECLADALNTGVSIPDKCDAVLEILFENTNNIYVLYLNKQIDKHKCWKCVV